MLLLVLAGNFVLLIVGWAFVGFASYALISFWYRREHRDQGGDEGVRDQRRRRRRPGPRRLPDLPRARHLRLPRRLRGGARETFTTNEGVVVAICLLLLVGAFAKSAQLPLHTWLPDAMEGPTPVSALIHAATMVTAGVYLIARMHPLFELAPTAADIAAFIGLATLLFAATIALVVTDLKRIIAYSTMSQIGYMVVGVSIGAYGGGLFHLMTHAFFKALLFMAAGSVIAAMANAQNIDRMSGFRRAMPFTSALLIVGALALAAFPGTSGFFSKDEILAFAAERGGMYWIFTIGGYLGALLTAFYAFRIVFRVVTGEPCEEARELEHGPPRPRRAAEPGDRRARGHRRRLPRPRAPHRRAAAADGDRDGVLGFRALFGGLVQIPGVDDVLEHFLERHLRGLAAVPHPSLDRRRVARASRSARLISHRRDRASPTTATSRARASPARADRAPAPPCTRFLVNKWYFDELIDALVYRPVLAIGRFANAVFERVVVDGIVSGDRRRRSRGAAASSAAPSRGFVRAYALLLIGGFAALGLYFLVVTQLMLQRRCSGCRSPSALARPLRCPRRRRRLVGGPRARWSTLGLAIGAGRRLRLGDAAGLQHAVDETWIPGPRRPLQLGVDGISLFLIAADRAALGRRRPPSRAFREPERARSSTS